MRSLFFYLFFLSSFGILEADEDLEFIEKFLENPYESSFTLVEFHGHECVAVLVKHYEYCKKCEALEED